MRVLFATWPWRNHFNPMVPLGWALRAAGHEVVVACHPSFARTITQAGLPALPVGAEVDLDEVLRTAVRSSTWRPRPEGRSDAENPLKRRKGLTVLRVAAASADAMADDALRFARRWRPDLVVFEPMGFLGPLLGAALGVPALRQLWTIDFLADIRLVQEEILGPVAERLGIGAVDALGTASIDPCPPRMQAPYDNRRIPARYVPYNGPAVEPAWLREPPHRPRICVTWGTSAAGLDLGEAFLAPDVVRALAGREVEVVVAVVSAQRELFGTPPANVVHLGPLPLDLVLPTCDALIHQGGGGTLMTAMKNAVPQFAIPYLPDATFNAGYVEGTGAGRTLFGGEASQQRLAAELDTFLSNLDRYQAAADRLHAEHLALPSVAEMVGCLG